MSRYIINGGKTLKGEVSIRGAKNASFKQIIASLLSSEPILLHNVPQISDVKITESIAKSLGSQIVHTGEHSLQITTPSIANSVVPHGTGEKSRTSFIFIAPLLLRTGTATIPIPGGDKLGARPLDRLFECLRQMNISIEEKNDLIIFNTKSSIKPVNYTFNKPSHTATEVLVMIASLTSGETILNNTALEPEIDDLIDLLNSMGARIKRQTNNPKTIIINGVHSLHAAEHQIIADRNEAVTFACAALATQGSINILRLNPKIIQTFLNTVQTMGAKINAGSEEVSISWTQPLKAISIETDTEPGFMTDWQPLFSVLLTQAIGCSTIIEKIWPSRFQHLHQLKKMGAKFCLFNPEISHPETYYHFNPENDLPDYFHGAKIYGPTKLKPADFTINDLRAGSSLTLAALTANGKSIIDNVEFIERGYEKLADRLCSLGADIQYIKT